MSDGDDGDEEFDESVDFDDFGTSMTPTKRLSKSIVPLAASIGFVATPSSKVSKFTYSVLHGTIK